MSAAAARRLTLTVGQRLFLAVVPALLAVVLVVALSYYGEIGRQAPGRVVAGSAALALVSVFVTWRNVRYVARRVGRLAGASPAAPGAAGDADELDRIEATVDRLGSALTASEAERARAQAGAEARLRDAAELLAATVDSALRRLDAVRLPLHILLDARFGELTPNQEELLADARDAAGAADEGLRQLRALADLDAGLLEPRRDWVAAGEVVQSVLAPAQAAATRRGVRVAAAVEPALPRVVADRVRLAEALALALADAVRQSAEGGEVRVAAARVPAGVAVTLAPAPEGPGGTLARRLLGAAGATVDAPADAPEGALRCVLPGR